MGISNSANLELHSLFPLYSPPNLLLLHQLSHPHLKPYCPLPQPKHSKLPLSFLTAISLIQALTVRHLHCYYCLLPDLLCHQSFLTTLQPSSYGHQRIFPKHESDHFTFCFKNFDALSPTPLLKGSSHYFLGWPYILYPTFLSFLFYLLLFFLYVL